MKAIEDVVCGVLDHGRFTHVARTLGKTFKKVYYSTPEERDAPIARECCIGDGFPEIKRVKSLLTVKDECDFFLFPDVGFEAEQGDLISQGFPVFGCRGAGPLETNRGLFLKVLAETNLPAAPHVVIQGLTNLRLHLRAAEDKYIKISKFRGDWETMHWTNFEDGESTLDSFAVRWGDLKEFITFYVFDPIDTEIEDGVDSWCVNGQFPETVLHGMECKDKSYVGTLTTMADIPKEVRVVNELFGPILGKMTNGGAMKFSTEVRITKDGQSFFIDPTCRFGSPPSQGECLLITNLAEIVYRGSMGELVEPEADSNFVVQARVHLEGDRTEWNSFKLDEELDEALMCGFCCGANGRMTLPPITDYHSTEVGYLCAVGDRLKEAIENLRELKDRLPDGLTTEFVSLADLLKEITSAEDAGMEFTEQEVPEPAVVIDSD